MPKRAFLSVVIATFQRETLLRETIADALAQEYPAFEIIVVDQSPTPITHLDARVRVIPTQPPHLPRARNLGVRAARGEMVVLVDDDVALPPNFLAMHAQCYADARVGGVAGRVILDPNPARPLVAPPATGIDFDRAQPGNVPFARGCNMSFRRAALHQAGLFDEHFSAIAWSEEEDLCFGIRRLGFQIRFEPRAWLIHRQARTGGMRTQRQAPADRADFYRDRVYFALKNVGGSDFWRVLGDAYRHALPPRAHGAQIVQRQFTWLRGSLNGLVHFVRYAKRQRPLPYRIE